MKDQGERLAVVWGAGGIGRALAADLVARGGHDRVFLVSRQSNHGNPDGIDHVTADLLDEASVEAAVASFAQVGTIDTAIVATGTLHNGSRQPEKTMRQIDSAALADVFAVNCIGPALVAKHLLPAMPRKGRAVFAAISARVGSISDNRLGGWHAYRASKAALNMLLKTLSIEWQWRNADAICVGLHPGTVDTDLSKPFQRGVLPEKLFTPEYSAARMLDVLADVSPEDSGAVFAYDGTPVPP